MINNVDEIISNNQELFLNQQNNLIESNNNIPIEKKTKPDNVNQKTNKGKNIIKELIYFNI